MMDAHEARAALAEFERRQQQTVEAGTAPWPWQMVLTSAAAFVAFGLLIDMDMIWLGALLVGLAAAAGTRQAVQLRRTKSSRGWTAALVATFFFALLADVAVQFAVRGSDLPLPNTWGSAAAALTVVLVGRPIQARTAASRRP